MMKVVLKLEFADDRIKKKAMQRVSGIPGVESIHIDPKDKKLTVTGDVDAVSMVSKLRKLCHTEILSVAPVEKKKDEPSKDDPKKDPAQTPQASQLPFYNPYNFQPNYQQSQAAVLSTAYHSGDDNPNSCIIC